MWRAAKRERASPGRIGVSVGIGTLSCFLPVFWMHLALSLLLATMLRVNRAWAAAASQLPSLFGLLRGPIVVSEIELGHRLRTGEWLVGLEVRSALAEAVRLLVDLWAGAAVVGPALGLLFGSAAYAYARVKLTPPSTPAGSPPPSSESPPSAPAAPTR